MRVRVPPRAPPHYRRAMPATPKQALTLFDATSLIVGIIVGAGIYQMAPGRSADC
ncbi:MAG: hypothetical protein MUF57_09875 [Gammaproteobacteria bacterium]|nr:hypothetical protein [Gammaproteobacteria bacterium]